MLTAKYAHELVDLLQRGELSAVEVLRAHVARIEQVNPSLNAMVVERLDAALEEAKAADRRRAEGQPCGRLHGLPIVIKELFDVAGFPTTAGIQKRRSVRVTRDATVVRRLRDAGAIVIGKTNVPQLGMLIESDNPVYGRTNNPWDLSRTPGGSSGGEAALIAAGGVPLGLGSDGAGSIRQPAHFCGICGFKPTGGRLPMYGHWLASNWPPDWVVPGPMARCVRDLVLTLEAMAPANAADRLPGEPPIPWEFPARFSESLEGVRIGYYEQIDALPVVPAVRRAVQEATRALTARGAELVPFPPNHFERMWDLFLKLLYAEGLGDVKRQVRGSPVDGRIRQMFWLTRVPGWLRPLLARGLQWVGQPGMAHSLANLERRQLPAGRYCELLLEMQALRMRHRRAMDRAGLDLLLGPVSPLPAIPHNDFFANAVMLYTGIFNLLGVPAGAVAMTTVGQLESAAAENGQPPRENLARSIWRANRQSAGLPLGVQVSGRWWRDERVLHAMHAIEAERERDPALGTELTLTAPWLQEGLGRVDKSTSDSAI